MNLLSETTKLNNKLSGQSGLWFVSCKCPYLKTDYNWVENCARSMHSIIMKYALNNVD